jgi:hypothetical protein
MRAASRLLRFSKRSATTPALRRPHALSRTTGKLGQVSHRHQIAAHSSPRSQLRVRGWGIAVALATLRRTPQPEQVALPAGLQAESGRGLDFGGLAKPARQRFLELFEIAL